MYELKIFESGQSARDYRHDNGTGGWIFVPEDRSAAILFPPYMAPSDIFRHDIIRGLSGNLLGA